MTSSNLLQNALKRAGEFQRHHGLPAYCGRLRTLPVEAAELLHGKRRGTAPLAALREEMLQALARKTFALSTDTHPDTEPTRQERRVAQVQLMGLLREIQQRFPAVPTRKPVETPRPSPARTNWDRRAAGEEEPRREEQEEFEQAARRVEAALLVARHSQLSATRLPSRVELFPPVAILDR
jgi:hypothetical protein